MAERLSLTARAHEAVFNALHAGDAAIDATAGNGWDSLFLARTVGDGGRVFAFDIQETAIEATRRRLAAEGLEDRVGLFQMDHRRLDEVIPAALKGRIAAVMFNLGYLPGGDKRLITETGTTLQALEKASRWLRPGGVLSIIAYPGHEGGRAELEAVRAWIGECRCLEAGSTVDSGHPSSPVLFVARRLEADC